jgi:Arc-like DNA binding domain
MARKIPRLAQTKIRLPTMLRRELQREADKHKRPLNAEILHRLDQSFLQQNFSALMREHIENTARATATKMQEHIDIACTAAATKAAEQVVRQLKQRSNDNDKAS